MVLAVWDEEKNFFDERYKTVGQATLDFLMSRGWCCWKCSTLGGDIIVVIRDEAVEGYPAGYPIYTAAELHKLEDIDEPQLRLIHEAKKLDVMKGELDGT